MRISGINFYNVNNNDPKQGRVTTLSYYLQPLKVDTVSFSGYRHTPNSYLLKELLKYGIPDIYSPVVLIDAKEVEALMAANVFELPLKKLVKVLKKYENSLFSVEKQVYELMKKSATVTPRMKLDEFIHSKVSEHSRKLLNIQRPIFEKLDKLALEMPSDLYDQYQFLIYKTDKKLSREPVFVPFSMKEFHYKLGRIKERIDKTKNKQAKSLISQMYNLAETSKNMSKQFSARELEQKQMRVLFKITDMFEQSNLRTDEDLKSLIESSRARLYKIPTNIKFNRKSFIYDLKEITEKLEDRKLAKKMIDTAIRLPTSKENISAFIMKAESRSSKQIGYDLFSGSIGSADHLIAHHNGGEDCLSNYVLASGYMNSEKAHESFADTLRKNPKIRIYAQRHIDKLIELANRGIFDKVGLMETYIPDLAKFLEKLSKPEPPLILDTSALKY